MQRLILVACIIFALGWLLACKPSVKPMVVINSPPSGTQVKMGEEVEIRSTATDEKGVLRVELWVDGALTGTTSAPTGKALPSFPASFSWTPSSPGSHTLEVRAYNVRGEASPPAAVIVNVIEAIVEATPTPQEWKLA
jgi:hypothetical protein